MLDNLLGIAFKIRIIEYILQANVKKVDDFNAFCALAPSIHLYS
jgi:hypothetical protein